MTITLKKLIAIFSSLMAVCALAFGGLLASPAPAYAAQPVQQGTPGPLADGAVIEYACREVGRTLEGQQDRINLANDIAAKSETWINDLKSKGRDVSALESALATYKAALATAQLQHDQAQSIYDRQAGFDGHCKLVDREQARLTLRDAGDALRLAHRTLSDAGRAFKRAVQDWRRANRPTPTTTP